MAHRRLTIEGVAVDDDESSSSGSVECGWEQAIVVFGIVARDPPHFTAGKTNEPAVVDQASAAAGVVLVLMDEPITSTSSRAQHLDPPGYPRHIILIMVDLDAGSTPRASSIVHL